MSSSTYDKLTLHSAKRNQDTSPLLHLPAELRNQIYAYAFGPNEIIVDQIEFGDGIHIWGNASRTRPGVFLQFTGTCRQMYSESITLYFQTRTFRFGPPDLLGKDTAVNNWLKMLSVAQRSAISHIAVHKDDLELEALWEQLPGLEGLKKMSLWGSYFMAGLDQVVVGKLEEINDRVDLLVGHHVEIEVGKTG